MEEERVGRAQYIHWLTLILIPVALVLGYLVLRETGSLAWLEALQSGPGSAAEQSQIISASGIIEVDEVSVSSEFGGRIIAIPVSAGQTVAAGDLLVELDTSSIDAQIEVAEAAVAWAEA